VASNTESRTKTEYLLSIIDNLVSETDARCQGSHRDSVCVENQTKKL
jgi:hypothetical protein